LRRDYAVVIPEDITLQEEILKIYHDNPYTRHFGRDQTVDLVARKY
jgi:hypothetical protein